MLDELKNIWSDGSEEERRILELAVAAIHQKRERNSAFISGFLGLKGEFIDEERQSYRFELPLTPFMHNSGGVVHGGILATLIDSAMGSLINRSLPPNQYAVTTELKLNYLLPGTGERLRAEASFLHRGHTLVVMEGSVYDDRDRRIAHGTGTFIVLSRNGRK
ncbi:PaaI family thioesterase [Brevibacillus sp. M2.1A]|uniref:PaaI family thioesterase n=1 Tax=Brevibacillus TaxID=55080 RepID=UPI00156AEE90|nr:MULTISPECIES: PaaI family thioesterase [Brevibacillus]MBY0086587.1 PaaI family thioesterase [Brevibacillus brevis]MCC8437593.1 PaaI family thioesterase [Brevibacillus sp. M2.1A]